jgi:hypothetical protein
MRKLLLVLAFLGLINPVLAQNYNATPGSGLVFGSKLVTAVNYPQIVFCDPTTPSQCVGVNASGQMTVLVAGTVAATQSGTWNINNISGTISLPTGAATSALQTTINTTLGSPFQAGGSIGNTTFAATQSGTWTVNPTTAANWGIGATAAAVPANAVFGGMSQGGNLTGLTGTSGNLNVQCANCSGSGVSTADEAAFTAGTSLFAGSGGFFQTTATSNPLTTGQQGMFQVTANRALFTNLRNASGTEIGTSTTPLVDTARVVGNAGAVMDAAGQNAAAPANWLATGCQFQTTPTTITAGNASPCQMDSAGNILVNVKSATGIAPGTAPGTLTGSWILGEVTTATPTDYTTATLDSLSLTTDGGLRSAPTAPAVTTIQTAAVANGNGTNLSTQGYTAAVLNVLCSVACSGGTTINFEASVDNTTFVPIQGINTGASTIATTTTTSGDWMFNLAGYSFLRARISAYSAGTISVKAYQITNTGLPPVMNSIITNTPAVTLASTTITGTVAATQSGTWNIGTVTTLPALPANQSVNVAQFGGVSTSTGQVAVSTAPTTAGNTALVVDLRPDSPGIIALGQTTKSASVPVTIASDQLGANTAANSLPVTIGPALLGSYCMGASTGTMAAGLAGGSPVYSFRYGGANLAIIRKVSIEADDVTTAFVAGTAKFDLIAARSFTASDTGGTSPTLTGNNGKLRTSFATTAISDLRISSTATLTAGTRTLDAQPLATISFAISTNIDAVLLPTTDLIRQNVGESPLVLATNEGFVIQATVPGTGTWFTSVRTCWDEVSAF